MAVNLLHSVSRRIAADNLSTQTQITRQERRERRTLRVMKAVLKFKKRLDPRLAVAIVGVLLFAQPAFCDSSFERIAKHVEDILLGPAGRSMALIGIVLGGILYVLGEGHARMLGQIAVGMGLILGATQIVAWATS